MMNQEKIISNIGIDTWDVSEVTYTVVADGRIY